MPRQFQPPKRQAKRGPDSSLPDSADDYLAAGVKQEEAGEKWRAGDAVKAARFFHRALETYDRGLLLFPASFDLVYNKARVLYAVTQHPALAASFPASLAELLDASLESHRRALSLAPDNADAVFNTAQVLTSIAEARDDDVASLYEEALELFQWCLAIQEAQFQESQDLAWTHEMEALTLAEAEREDAQMDEGMDVDVDELEDRWAAIVEPVTESTLVDTISAILDTLAALCGATQAMSAGKIVGIERQGETMSLKLRLYGDALDDDLKVDAIITHAKFVAAVAEARFRLLDIDLNTFQQQVSDAFASVATDLVKYASYLCAYADALIAINAAAATRVDFQVQWPLLTKALELLTQASKLPLVDDKVAVHIGRGDVEMLRLALMGSDSPHSQSSNAAATKQTLLNNAATYYRGAVAVAGAADGLSRRSPRDFEARVKQALVDGLKAGNNDAIKAISGGAMTEDMVRKVLAEMVDEGLIQSAAIQSLGMAVS